MNKIYMASREFRKNRSPYMTVLPIDMWRVRRAYGDMRKSGVDSLDAAPMCTACYPQVLRHEAVSRSRTRKFTRYVKAF